MMRPRRAKSTSSTRDETQWVCTSCTRVNNDTTMECSRCLAVRPLDAPQLPPLLSRLSSAGSSFSSNGPSTDHGADAGTVQQGLAVELLSHMLDICMDDLRAVASTHEQVVESAHPIANESTSTKVGGFQAALPVEVVVEGGMALPPRCTLSVYKGRDNRFVRKFAGACKESASFLVKGVSEVRIRYQSLSNADFHGYKVTVRQRSPEHWHNELHVLGRPTQRWATWLCSSLLNIVLSIPPSHTEVLSKLPLAKWMKLMTKLVLSDSFQDGTGVIPSLVSQLLNHPAHFPIDTPPDLSKLRQVCSEAAKLALPESSHEEFVLNVLPRGGSLILLCLLCAAVREVVR